jgi:hypothetical protein
MPWWQGPTYPE